MTEAHIAPRLSKVLVFNLNHAESHSWSLMALTFPAQLQNLMPFDASKPRDLYFPYSSHLSGHKKKARKNSIRLLVKFWNRLCNFKQFKLKSISGKSIWVGTVQHSLTSSDLANVCKKRGNNIGLDALDGWAGESCEIMGLMLASFTGNVDDQDNLAIVLVQGHFLSINILHLANTNKTPMPTTSFWIQAPTLQVSLHICKHLYLSSASSLIFPWPHQNLPWSRRYCHPPLPSKLAQMYNFHCHSRFHGIFKQVPNDLPTFNRHFLPLHVSTRRFTRHMTLGPSLASASTHSDTWSASGM